MREILWISLPEQVAQETNKILEFINEKKLNSLSVKQLLLKLINKKVSNQTKSWKHVFEKYNDITAVKDIDLSLLHLKALSLNNQFLRYEEELENKLFKPNELISLIILNYFDSELIGSELCKALKTNNKKKIAKEILENSAYVKTEKRIVSSVSNLRLLNYALYANDTSVLLPKTVRNRIRKGTMRKGITLLEVGQFPSMNRSYWLNLPPSSGNTNILDAASIPLEELQADEPSGYRAITQRKFSLPANTGNSNDISSVLVFMLALFSLSRITPIDTIFCNLYSAIFRNLCRDMGNVANYIGNFFSKKNLPTTEHVEHKKSIFFSCHS